MLSFPKTVVNSFTGVAANGGTATSNVMVLDAAIDRVQAFVASTRTFAAWLEYSPDGGTTWITAGYSAHTDATANALWQYIASIPSSAPAVLAGVRIRVRVMNTDASNTANIRVLIVGTEH